MTKKARHFRYMDVLNVLSCFAVVVLHCTTVVYVNQGNVQWFVSVALQSLFMFAVPVFFMISGANLIGYRSRYSTKVFFQKRLKRVLATLVGFSLFIYILSCLVPTQLGLPPRSFSVAEFIDLLLTNRICDVYWFMYSILILYLITPLLASFASSKRLLEYAIGLCVVSTAIIPFANRFAPNHDLFSVFAVPYLTGAIMYYLIGYYIVTYSPLDKRDGKMRPAFLIAAICSVVFMALMTIKTNVAHTVLSGAYSDYDNFYNNYLHLPVLVYSVSLFMLFRSLEPLFQSDKYPFMAVISKLSSFSFDVYAVHMMLIWALDVYVPHSIFWDAAIRPFVVFALSLLFAFVLESLKKFCRNTRIAKV